MIRKDLYDYVEERIAVLAYRVEMRGKLNVLDLHLHSENFYRDFLNLLYGWNLENLNKANQNVEANASSRDLSVEAIDVCADILVVDAFIRCKIFENPKGYSNVTA